MSTAFEIWEWGMRIERGGRVKIMYKFADKYH